MTLANVRDDDPPVASPEDGSLPPATQYASVTRAWVSQTRMYVHSARLFEEAMLRHRRGRARERSRRLGLVAVEGSAITVSQVSVPRRQIGVGGEAIGPRVIEAPRVVDRLELAAPSPLTRRQLEIAQLIAQGLTNSQIATRIVVSRGTVGNHIGHMLRRLGVKNRAQIAAWATQRSSKESSPGG